MSAFAWLADDIMSVVKSCWLMRFPAATRCRRLPAATRCREFPAATRCRRFPTATRCGQAIVSRNAQSAGAGITKYPRERDCRSWVRFLRPRGPRRRKRQATCTACWTPQAWGQRWASALGGTAADIMSATAFNSGGSRAGDGPAVASRRPANLFDFHAVSRNDHENSRGSRQPPGLARIIHRGA